MIRPQRFENARPPGTLLKRLFALRRIQRADPGSEPSYLWKIRQLPCIACGVEPCGVAAHVRMNSGPFNKRQAMAKKPHPKWCISLCSDCHTNDPLSQHRVGEQLFWHRIGINPLLVCERLFEARGDLVRMRAIILSATAERG